MLKYKMTGPAFSRVLKNHKILPSVFAFKTKIELTKIKQISESKEPVPELYIQKLEQVFDVEIR